MGHYKVVFLGLAIAGPEEEARLLKGLQKKFNLSPERAERLLQKVPVVVKKGDSKEELLRYVKAFEEIGGRVRLEEEEPLLEAVEPPPEPEPERKPFPKKMITCPQCGFEQPEAEECVKCGLVFSRYGEEEEAPKGRGGPAPEARAEDREPSWESGEGFFFAFLKTIKNSLFRPTQFFRKNAVGDSYGSPLIYALIVGIIGVGGSMFWQWLVFSRIIPERFFSFIPYDWHLMAITLLLPIGILFSIVLGSAITHLCLIIVGGNKMGFRTTFRTVCFAYSGHLFGIIPLLGGPVGNIYALILTILGVREGHRISTGRAVLAVLFPLILLAGLGIIALIFIPLFLGSMRMIGGVGV